ncbi:unnamed protein product [Ectocarpus sp. 6 AP-2014]
MDADEAFAPATSADVKAQTIVDLEAMEFTEGGHLMTNKRCDLHSKSWRAQKKGYEEVHVPAVKHIPVEGEKLIPIEDLPKWTQPAFKGMEKLNRIQSKMHEAALLSPENLLLCAPTGAGKTNVALMTMLHEIGQHRKEDGTIDVDSFKIVYVAPMKALVQEVVGNFGKRLQSYGVTVKELSGDQSLSRQQIQETQVIVTTPEKWDIITRKAGDRTYTQLVRLVIIDEIHLLHDNRGPVLESLVARTIRQIEATQEMVRIVGLSATLPNYEDVATFLNVNPEKGLFYFDNSYRPVPLQQQYIGVTEKKAIKRFQLMNEICYEKVMAQAGRNQVLIFVHSRAETAKTAKALRDMTVDRDTVTSFMKEDSASAEILKEMAAEAKNEDLKDVLGYSFAIHHAGLPKGDRQLVEDLFQDKHIQVLVSTATLAWGVNLPAHTVILKGTQMYSPEKGKWVELSPLDILQMMGRAGRPQYDSEGEAIVITQHSELQYYLSLNNQQLPIESQYVSKLADNLNAEIVQGTVQSVAEAAQWLGYTYLYVRMMQNPGVYRVPPDQLDNDPVLLQFRVDLVHTAATILDKTNLIKYDRSGKTFQPTPLGRVASYFYVTHQTMARYNEYLKPTMSDIEIFRLFSLSGEFSHIVVKDEEKLELGRLASRVPIPIKESVDEPTAKVNALLQAFISQLKLEGYALVSDMTYVQQSAARLCRALFEVALKRGWAALAEKTLDLCKMVERRCWLSQSPLRQFRLLPEVIVRKLERKEIAWDRYYDLKPADLGELVKLPRMGKTLHRLVHQFPRVELAASVQPITRALLRVELTITPDFLFDQKVHDYAVLFWILVEDVDGEKILHHEPFLLKQQYADKEHMVSFTVPIKDPLPPNYFIKVISDRWMHSEAVLPVSFRNLILPAKYPPHSELLDLQPLPVSALKNPAFEKVYSDKGIQFFNAIQTQVFQELHDGDANVLVCAPTGSGKTACAELALMRLFTTNPTARAVYIAPKAEIASLRFRGWSKSIGEGLGKTVVELTGEAAADLKLLERGTVIVATAQHWDALSRRWKQRKNVQDVALLIADELHLLGGPEGPTLEVVVSRMRYISSQLEKKCRIVGLSASLANAKDVGDWIGATAHSLVSFRPDVRPVPLEIKLHGFDVNHFGSRMLAMAKPAYNYVAVGCAAPDNKPAIVFVPSRKQSQLTAIDMVTYAAADGEPNRFLTVAEEEIAPVVETVREAALQQTLGHGVGFVHQGMLEADRKRVEGLYRDGIIKVLVVPFGMCWSLDLSASLVVVMGTESYDGREHKYVDYPVTDLLHMTGLASRPLLDSSGRGVLLCHTPKREYIRKLLYDPLPIESHLDHVMAEHMNAEVVTKTIENKQDAVDYLTWTFYYRRLTQNPNYYDMGGSSHRHLSDHLSELVERVVGDLEEARAVSVEDDMNLSALNLGMIAAYYYLQYTTIELFANSYWRPSNLRLGLLDIVASASEFNELPVRQQEEKALKMLAHHLPQKLPNEWQFSDTNAKAHVLLQSHFSRTALSTDLRADQKVVLLDSVRLLQAVVDVISSNGWLKPALEAMELSQMMVQGVWAKDSYLRQVPHFSPEVIQRCEGAGVETPFDIMGLEDDERDRLLDMPQSKMGDVANFCNAFPNVEMDFEVQESDDITAGDPVTLVVSLEREGEEDEDEPEGGWGKVCAPLYPKSKTEAWWVVVGDKKKNTLLAIKRVTLQRKTRAKLEFAAPDEVGEHTLELFLMCDSYVGCDQEYAVELMVGAAGSDDESEED